MSADESALCIRRAARLEAPAMSVLPPVPALRVRACNRAPLREEGDFVLYWMVAFRRTRWNFALQRAVELAAERRKPLVVLEPLRVAYRWASDRHHRFVLDGMRDDARALAARGVLHHPYLERVEGEGRGLLEALEARAVAVVTDDWPSFFVPRMIASAAEKLAVRLEAVDSNGLLPLRAAERTFVRAHDFRRFLHRVLPEHLDALPRPDPLEGVSLPPLCSLPAAITRRWPAADPELLAGGGSLRALPIDHDVAPVPMRGGSEAAERVLARFLDQRIERYGEGHAQPGSTSGLSPWLHFGHVAAHEVFHRVAQREGWHAGRIHPGSAGSREGWWGLSTPAETFLDELVTWRELGFHTAWREPDAARYETLPAWARATLEEHARDERPRLYDLAAFERAETHDELWNAIQRQLLGEGRIESYLRMLWGKKILHWTRSPREALEVMLVLNDKYAVDGRDPNSISGITWILGRYDRPWGPERPVFGKVRTMTSESTRRKLRLGSYLATWGADGPSLPWDGDRG